MLGDKPLKVVEVLFVFLLATGIPFWRSAIPNPGELQLICWLGAEQPWSVQVEAEELLATVKPRKQKTKLKKPISKTFKRLFFSFIFLIYRRADVRAGT